jgi:hypothetical protein
MTQINNHKKFILQAYIIIFYVLMVYKFFMGMFLYQFTPVYFFANDNIINWILINTGFLQIVSANKMVAIALDALYYTAPILLYGLYRFKKIAFIVAIYMLLVNWLYVHVYTSFITNSIEAHTAWLLFPVLFLTNDKKWIITEEALRYFFLFFFASAGIWKITQGCIFNTHQMSNILFTQHKELLLLTPNCWYASCIQWLIQHNLISYSLYAIATVAELVFIVGFFTKKYDTHLIGIFIIFLIFDHFLMRIPYYDVLPYLILLLPKPTWYKTYLQTL